MKDKIIMLIIGILIGAIIASAGFLIFGGNKKGRGDFDPSKFKDGNMEPPNFSRDGGDFNNIDSNKIPEKSRRTENDSNRNEAPSNNDSSTNDKTS